MAIKDAEQKEDEPATPHPEFFVQDNEMIVIQAQRQLFRLPKYILMKSSPTFRELLSKATKPADFSEPTLKLDNVTGYEFETLCMEFHGQIDIKTAPLKRVAALLAVCHRFDIIDVRRRLVPLIFNDASSLPPVEQLRLAELHEVAIVNCVPALTAIVMNKQGLQEQDFAKLSHGMAAWLMEAREQFIRVTTEQHVRRNLGEGPISVPTNDRQTQHLELACKIVVEVWGLSQKEVDAASPI